MRHGPFQSKVATNSLYRYRQRQCVQRLLRNNLPAENNLQPAVIAQDDGVQQQQQATQEDGNNAFGDAFRIGDADLPEAARARQRQIEQEVAEEP